MLLHGVTSNPVITGSSVHNQRIERLWSDTYRCVLSLFYYLEDNDKLDPVSDVDLYCLHRVYVSKINLALRFFAEGWNSHAMTTEYSMTPAQMFTAGTLMAGRSMELSSDFEENITSDLGPPSVLVLTTNCPLDSRQTEELNRLIANADKDDEYTYIVKLYLLTFTQMEI